MKVCGEYALLFSGDPSLHPITVPSCKCPLSVFISANCALVYSASKAPLPVELVETQVEETEEFVHAENMEWLLRARPRATSALRVLW